MVRGQGNGLHLGTSRPGAPRMPAGRFTLKSLVESLNTQPPTPHTTSSWLTLALFEPAMAFPNRVRDPEVAAPSDEFVLAQYLQSLPKFPSDFDYPKSDRPPLPPVEKNPKSLPYSSFLIPKSGLLVSSQKAKRLSRCGRLQLWFNTYR